MADQSETSRKLSESPDTELSGNKTEANPEAPIEVEAEPHVTDEELEHAAEESEEDGHELPVVTSAQLDAQEKTLTAEPSKRLRFLLHVVDDATWPSAVLLPKESWAPHALTLEQSCRKPGIRAVIFKTEKCGPKTIPHTEYVIHVKTAFSVRALARRFNEFRALDEKLRIAFVDVPHFPRPKVIGHMKPRFIESRKRQLQTYLDGCLASRSIARCEAIKEFLQIGGHAIEDDIINGKIADGPSGLNFWKKTSEAEATTLEHIVAVCREAETEDPYGAAVALNRLGLHRALEGNYDQAAQILGDAVTTCMSQDHAVGAIVATANLAAVQVVAGQAAAGADKLLRALEALHRLHPDDVAEALDESRVLSNLAAAQAAGGELPTALVTIDKVRELCVESRDTMSEGSVLFCKGLIHAAGNSIRLAVEALEESQVVRRRLRDKLGLAEGLWKLGGCFAEIGYHLHALDYLEQALALARELGDPFGIVLSLLAIGHVRNIQGEPRPGLVLLEEAVALCEKHHMSTLLGRCLWQLATLEGGRGDMAAACRAARGCLDALRVLPDSETDEPWVATARDECTARLADPVAASLQAAPPSSNPRNLPRKPVSARDRSVGGFHLAFKVRAPSKALSNHMGIMRGLVSHKFR